MTLLSRILAVFRPKAMGTLSPVDDRRGWFSLAWPGTTWQTDTPTFRHDDVLANYAVYACMTLIASDIGKMQLRLMEQSAAKIWEETQSPAFSPVLRKPNHFQTRQQFVEYWVASKLSYGNAYILKARDARGVVTQMYVLDPNRVRPMVAPDGSVFYQLMSDDLSRLPFDFPSVPASEIIHDRMECLFHPLVGMSPLFACGLAASQGLKILNNSATFFENMSRPSGILTAPGQISDETALRLKEHWETNYKAGNIGKIAVLGDDLKYAPMMQTAVDSDLVAQFKLSAEQICAAFHVPPYMVNIGPAPAYNNIEALSQQYYSQCLQKMIEAIEAVLDEGLGLWETGRMLRTEFDLDDLLRMDTKTLAEVEGAKVKNGISSPNEARRKFSLPPVKGGETPYLQQQNYNLEALSKRDAQDDPFGTAAPAAPDTPPPDQAAGKMLETIQAQLLGFDSKLAELTTKTAADDPDVLAIEELTRRFDLEAV